MKSKRGSARPTSEAAPVKCAKLLEELRTLWTRATKADRDFRVLVHRIASVMVSLYQDQGFRGKFRLIRDQDVSDALEREIPAWFRYRFAELKQMLEAVPDREVWAAGDLADIQAKAEAARRPKSSPISSGNGKSPAPDPRSVSLATLRQAADDAKAAVVRARVQHESIEDQLRRKIARLERELKTAKRRIHELQARLAALEPVAVG